MFKHLAVATTLASVVVLDRAQAQGPSCASGPDIYADWLKATLPGGGSSQALEAELTKWRASVSQLRDPFRPLVGLSTAQLDSAKERRLWLDSVAMVLVDRFAASPELLVIPRDSAMFAKDLSPAVLKHLSNLAALARSAMMSAAGRACDSTSALIFVNPPAGLSVRQLHVHVIPRPAIVTSNAVAFFAEVERRLRTLVRNP